jgi:hypothetical protein
MPCALRRRYRGRIPPATDPIGRRFFPGVNVVMGRVYQCVQKESFSKKPGCFVMSVPDDWNWAGTEIVRQRGVEGGPAPLPHGGTVQLSPFLSGRAL